MFGLELGGVGMMSSVWIGLGVLRVDMLGLGRGGTGRVRS